MGSLFHPIGSQPAWVYWARRGALVLAVVAVIAALIFVFRPQPEAPVAVQPDKQVQRLILITVQEVVVVRNQPEGQLELAATTQVRLDLL